MELRILDERKNPLLKRTEYRFEIGHAEAATPSRDAVRQELAKLTRTPKDRLIVERMNAKFGFARSVGIAVAYETHDALASTVREHIQIRNGLKEKPSAATPAEAPKAEAPPPTPEKKE